MLEPADAEIADRDPALPALRVVLDHEALTSLVAELLPADAKAPERVTVTYLRYKPGTSLTAALRLGYGGRTRRAFLRAYTAEGDGKLGKDVRHAEGPPAPAPPGVDLTEVTDPGWRGPLVAPDLGLVVAAPADDRALPALRHFAGAPGFASQGTRRARTLRHKPGRRWVGRLDGDARRPEHVLRAHSGGVNVAPYVTLAAAGLPVPEVTRVSRFGLLATRWIPGTPLDGALAAGDVDAPAAVGGLLARLHAVPAPRELPEARPTDPAVAARAVAALLPDLAARAEQVAQACARALEPEPGVLVHGDLSADQVLLTERGPALIDLDRVRVDAPAADLASFVAAEIAAGRALAGAEPDRVLGPLLDSYLEARPGRPRPRGLAAHTAAALLNRCAEPFRHRVPGWAGQARMLVETAAGLVGA
ncbi:phosphotransferase [Marinactinospora thermotolerans]|uniref:phosphotransferase n=1 Tax=Marinactinospora thermotolerans TaxID=531310 RepID=UPI003D92B404